MSGAAPAWEEVLKATSPEVIELARKALPTVLGYASGYLKTGENAPRPINDLDDALARAKRLEVRTASAAADHDAAAALAREALLLGLRAAVTIAIASL